MRHSLAAFEVTATLLSGTRIARAQMSSSAGPSSLPASQPASKTGKKTASNKPTPEEIEAKREARAAKKEREAAEQRAKQAQIDAAVAANGTIPNGHLDENGRSLFVPRQWASVTGSSHAPAPPGKRRIKIVSWNILAQGLVRRTLFPGSDCLKFKDRCTGLAAELSSRTGHGWDVGAFQEVDRMDVHGPMINKDGFSYVYEKGYRQKQHGLLIAWRKDLFGSNAYRQLAVDLDAESIADKSQPMRTACSRITRNIGLFVALQAQSKAEDTNAAHGMIIATTHLFWHPMHAYERARQSGILVRKLAEFRASLGKSWSNAPCIFAGDMNDQPHSATYHLLTGQALSQHCTDELQQSTVVHKSIDDRLQQQDYKSGFAPGTTHNAQDVPKKVGAVEAVVQDSEQANNEEADVDEDADDVESHEEEEGGADDQMLKNCRPATAEDGLLSIEELQQLHDLSRDRPSMQPTSQVPSATVSLALRSCYGLHYDSVSDPSEQSNMFGSAQRGRERWDDANWTPGQTNIHTGPSAEPMWTIFSSLFSLTLDYIFILPPSDQAQTAKVTSLLRTHRTETLQPGVPRKGVCASDHVAIGAEIEL